MDTEANAAGTAATTDPATAHAESASGIDARQLRGHFDEVVRAFAEQILNALLDSEADALCRATRYGWSSDRRETLASHHARQLHTRAGEVTLEISRLRNLPFNPQIIEGYRRRESSFDKAVREMYLASGSVQRVEDITQALRGTRVCSRTVSELHKKIHAQEDRKAARPKALQLVAKPEIRKLAKAAMLVQARYEEILV
jgi:transposase-like protein